MSKKRLFYVGLLAAVLGIFFIMTRVWPHEQTVHLILGEAAPRVTEVELTFAPVGAADDDDDQTRRVTHHYPNHDAPQVVTEEPKLSNGDWIIRATVVAAGNSVIVRRRLKLTGGVVTLDVTRDVPNEQPKVEAAKEPPKPQAPKEQPKPE